MSEMVQNSWHQPSSATRFPPAVGTILLSKCSWYRTNRGLKAGQRLSEMRWPFFPNSQGNSANSSRRSKWKRLQGTNGAYSSLKGSPSTVLFLGLDASTLVFHLHTRGPDSDLFLPAKIILFHFAYFGNYFLSIPSTISHIQMPV